MTDSLPAFLRRPDIRQFVLYAICGGAGVMVDLTCYAVLLHQEITGYQGANLAGYFMGTMISFALNRHFTFQAYDKPVRRLGLFLGVAFTGYLVSSVLLWLQIGQLGFHPIAAKLATLFVVLVLQFSINRAVTFRTRNPETK